MQVHEMPQEQSDFCHEMADKNAKLVAILRECEEYFDQRADADQPSGSAPIPNEEMTLLCEIREVLPPKTVSSVPPKETPIETRGAG